MFKVKSLMEVSNFAELVNLIDHFIDRKDLNFYKLIIETNYSGKFTIYRDLEEIYIEQEQITDKCRLINTGKFNKIKDAIAFIKLFEDDIIMEVEIKITINNIEKISEVLDEIRQFNPIAIQITTEAIIYEEFRN